MSGIAGILHLDGAPTDAAILTRMTEAIAHRGPDGVRKVIDGPAGLGHCLLCTTSESLHDAQPLWDESARYCLSMDGRVDNREELSAAVLSAGLALRDDTDAELVLKAFLAWGEGAPARILGDFAFAVHDRVRRCVFCARDVFGVKPFYYFADAKVFLCATELKQLFEHPAVRKVPNEGMVAEYLAAQITSLEETLYADIFRLPPAHWMRVSAEGIVRRRYWDADPTAEPAKGPTADLALQLREILKEAVRCRLRSHRPVGAELSGGLDSSSVVGLAQLLFREGRATDLGFEAFSLVFPGLPCDESEYIDAMVERWGLRSNRFSAHTGPWYEDSARRHQDFPDHPNGYMSVPICAELQRKGFRAYLSGVGGDQWLDRLSTITWRDRVRARLGRYPWLLASVRRALGRRPGGVFVSNDLAQRVRLEKRLAPRLSAWRFRSLPQRWQHAMLTDGHCVHALEMTERLDAQFQVESRNPLYDRRLVEFMLPLADGLYRQGEVGKILLRAAVSDLLPPLVRDRRTKAEFSHVVAFAVKQAGAALERPAIRRRGWLKPPLATDWHAHADGNPWWAWLVLGIETWYRLTLSQRGTDGSTD